MTITKTREKGKKKRGEKVMSFVDHLEELRLRLIYIIVGLVVAAVICFIFAGRIQEVLVQPYFREGDSSLALLNPTEGFLVQLKISLIAGFFLALPFIFYHFWHFVAPGLLQNEKKYVLPIIFFSTLSFLLGGVFAYHILPYATRFFQSFSSNGIVNTWSLGKYIGFIARLMLAFGVVFELPIVIFFLAKVGVVSPQFLKQKRKHVIVLFFVMAAVITPPDVFTQLILVAPLIILFEISILLAKLAYPKEETSG